MPVWRTLRLDDPIDARQSTPEIIYVSGSAYERGKTHGAVARAKIRQNVAIVDRILAEHPDVSRDAFDRLVVTNRPFATAEDEELTDTVRGIAEGAEVDEAAIWALNLPAHFILGRIPLDCSQVFIGGERVNSPLLGKTRDFSVGGAFKQSVLVTEFEDGTRSIAGHSSGSVTWPGSGVTNHGVAYSTSGVWSPRVVADINEVDKRWLLFNGEIVARRAKSASEFARLASEQARIVGINLLTADATDAFSVELTAENASITEATDGTLVLTNHYVTESGEFGEIGPKREEYENTFRREQFLREHTGSRPGGWDLSLAQQLLDEAPICREAEADSQSISEYSSLADPAEGLFSIRIYE